MERAALVTGANGFVGRILCSYLADRGWRVRGGVFGAEPASEAEAVCDVARRDDVARLVDWAGPITHVFHLAARTFVPDSIQSPAACMAVNIEGTVHVLDVVRERVPEARVVYVGSAGAYGQPQTLPVTEDHPLNPLNPYDISKAAADQYCAFFHEATGLDVIRTRPFNHSGPGQSELFVLPAFARQLARIEAGLAPPTFRVGNLDKARDFLHVNDVVAAYEAVAVRGAGGRVYNICCGQSTPIRAALDGLLALTDVEVEVVVDEGLLRPVDAADVVGSHDRITADTGWRPAIPFEGILRDLLEEWRGRVGGGTA
ncbi:MAG: GDP-mannose 4,6-dehydratase [Candidatus Hydrogenedentes bacterium]|nr:GDP-mannose 4,6-dehydratase [Candidatus Hydrogenedentota bacterium]